MNGQIYLVFCCLVAVTVSMVEGKEDKWFKRQDDWCEGLDPDDVSICDDGTCIPKSFICDGAVDCDDKSDKNCEGHVCNERAQVSWGDNTCRTLHYRCNDIDDCPNGADEQGCPANLHFTCSNGDVVSGGVQRRCDGTEDCTDGSDEVGCQYNFYVCDSAVQMSCNDGSCRPLYYQCDGTDDCPDGEDEVDCY